MRALVLFQARIYNKPKNGSVAVQRLPNRYYTAKNVQCRNCNKNGHLSKNCPEPKVNRWGGAHVSTPTNDVRAIA